MTLEPQRINPALVDPVGAPQRTTRPQGTPAPGQPNFTDALRDAAGVKFSKHAAQRLERRELTVDSHHLERLGHAVDQAAAKGGRSALVLVDDLTFVVGVPAKTVITAIDRNQMKDNVFTNIDTVVFG